MSLQLLDEQGRRVQLGKKLHEGGEGFIWEVLGAPDILVKTYKKDDPEKSAKLKAMPTIRSADVLKIAAWPNQILFDPTNRQVAGFAMARIPNHHEIHQLYSPPSRRIHFPEATWEFLVHVAMNCAAAFETVHAAGQVIGDVNQSGVLVSKQGTVRLIDCDSFQVQANGHVYLCVVGVPEFTPPELQGTPDFRAVRRTVNHDNFGLALLIFHLLFMGRHPFVGRTSGKRDLALDQLIKEGKFAFSSRAASFQMSPPPHALPLSALHPQMGAMFERAFSVPSPNLLRPTAKEWRESLASLKASLVKCSDDAAHVFPRHLNICPWCRIEEERGPAFFVASNVTLQFDAGFDLISIWSSIERASAVPLPEALNITRRGKACTPKPIPQDARFDLIGAPHDPGSPPSLNQEALPTIVPYRSVAESIPPDAAYQSLPKPVIHPRYLQPSPQKPIKSQPPSSLLNPHIPGTGDYLIIAWTAALSTVADVICASLQPWLAGLLAMIPIVFGVVWFCMYIKRRWIFQDIRANVETDRKRREAEFERAENLFTLKLAEWGRIKAECEAEYQLRCQEAEALWQRNEAEHHRAWETEIQRLAKLREEAPLKEVEHRRQWEEYCKRIEVQRAEIETRNTWAKAEWTLATERYNQAVAKAHAIRTQIGEARARFDAELAVRQQRRDRLASELGAMQKEWESNSYNFQYNMKTTKDPLEKAKKQYEELRRGYDQELNRRMANQREAQLRDYLNQVLIDNASIEGFKKKRKALLAAHGIETALDIDQRTLENIVGLGPKRITDLLLWRHGIEQQFRFNPSKGMPEVEIRSLHAQFQARRQTLQRTLRGGREQLEVIQNKAKLQLDQLQRRADETIALLNQADADVLICSTIDAPKHTQFSHVYTGR